MRLREGRHSRDAKEIYLLAPAWVLPSRWFAAKKSCFAKPPTQAHITQTITYPSTDNNISKHTKQTMTERERQDPGCLALRTGEESLLRAQLSLHTQCHIVRE